MNKTQKGKGKGVAKRDDNHYTKGLPAPLVENYAWKDQANCKDMDTEIFFLPWGARTTTKKKLEDTAKAICISCPVVQQCLEFALATEETYGVWGGTTPEERAKILEQRKLEASGYEIAN